MKMIKKLLVAVLAMAMVLGTMAVSTFAAEYEVKVTVEWAGDETLGDIDNMSLWIWGDGGVGLNYTESQAWPGDALTKNADGTWSGTFTVKENAVKVIPNVTVGDVVYQTVDSDSLDSTKGEIIVKVGAAGEDGKYAIDSVTYGTGAEDAPAGDSTAVMGYVVAAVVALAAVVTVISKKRSVEA
jgi:hypothetical protein